MNTERYVAAKLGLVRTVVMALRESTISAKRIYLTKIKGMDLHPTIRFSLKCNLDTTNPKGVHIGSYTYLSFGSVVLTHDMCRQFHADTYIGSHCFIGAHAIVMPGVKIGDHCVVGTAAVVTQDVPDGTIVAGNPAKIIRSGIRTKEYGKLLSS